MQECPVNFELIQRWSLVADLTVPALTLNILGVALAQLIARVEAAAFSDH